MATLYFPLLLMVISAVATSPEETYRLPSTHVPSHYLLNFYIHPNIDVFYGKVTITFATSSETKSILLHASPKYLNITKVQYEFVHPCSYTVNEETEIANITCQNEFPEGYSNKISIEYTGVYPQDNLGLYKTTYDYYGTIHSYISTQFESTYARRAFPCFDEPSFKATFGITISHPNIYSALANTPVVERQYTSDGNVSTQFELTPSMSTYLIAFVVSNFEKSNIKLSGEKDFYYNVYTRNEMKKYTSTALKYGAKLVSCLGKWTGIHYEDLGDSQIDQVAVIDFQYGAMENWGLIIYREMDLLDEGEKTAEAQKQNIITTIAHELTHQWFGDYVTLDWWSDTWLNEGFATYFEYYIPDQCSGIDLESVNQFTVDALQVALQIDAFPSSPLSSKQDDIKTPDEDFGKFDKISYQKGASIIRMMSSILGEKNFQKGIQSYLATNKYNNTSPTALLNSLEQFYHGEDSLQDLMHNWIYESGYPLVTVSLDNTGTVEVSQKQFHYLEFNDTKSKQWQVPISYKTSDDKNFTVDIKDWLKINKTLKIDMEGASWILLNLQQTGFYRVNYDDELWNRIIKFLKGVNKDQIHVYNRAQLVDDIFANARLGHVSYETAFELADYLQHETNYQPWVSALNSLTYIWDQLVDEEVRQLLKSVILKWLNTAFPSELNVKTHLEIMKSVLILEWKCKLGDKSCLSYAKQSYTNYKTNHIMEDYNKRKTILCHGLRISKTPEEDYALLLLAYTDSDSVIERNAILHSLGCTDNSKVLLRYLSQIVSDNMTITKQDVIDVYKAVSTTNKNGLNATLTFLEAHIKDVLERYKGLIDVSTLISGLADKITTDEELDTLKQIIKDHAEIEGIEKVGEKVFNIIEANMNWTATYTDHIKKGLEAIKNSSSLLTSSFLSVFLCITTIVTILFQY